MKSDSELIMEYRKGRIKAFEELYERYRDGVYFYSLSLAGDPGTAEECAQEAFIGFAKNIDSFNTDGSVKSYLLRSARNRVIDNKRRLESKSKTLSFGNLDLFEIPEHSAESSELAGIASKALEELDDEQREVVVLKIYESMTFREIGEVTGVSENTAASRYRYALEKMREKLMRRING